MRARSTSELNPMLPHLAPPPHLALPSPLLAWVRSQQ